MALTAAQAIARLKNINTIEQLNDLVRKIDVSAPGNVTLLYSGTPEGSRYSNRDLALELAAQDPNIRIIDHTEVAKFLDIEPRSENWNKALVDKLEQLLDSQPDLKGTPANQWLYGG